MNNERLKTSIDTQTLGFIGQLGVCIACTVLLRISKMKAGIFVYSVAFSDPLLAIAAFLKIDSQRVGSHRVQLAQKRG